MQIRPAESAWQAVVSIQKDNLEKETQKGIKKFIHASGSTPPPSGKPSNFNSITKTIKYLKRYQHDISNRIQNINLNKLNLAKYLKYFN